jgi:hypothetical protein
MHNSVALYVVFTLRNEAVSVSANFHLTPRLYKQPRKKSFYYHRNSSLFRFVRNLFFQ